MQSATRLTVAAAVLGLLVVSQADARGGGGGGGGRGGGFAFHSGVVFRNGAFVHRQGFPIRHPLAARNLRQQRFGNNFNNGVGGVWPGYWGNDWGGGYSYPQQAEAPAPQPPQIIVINSDGNGRMTTAEATPADPPLVPGCHAISNGYHCDIQ